MMENETRPETEQTIDVAAPAAEPVLDTSNLMHCYVMLGLAAPLMFAPLPIISSLAFIMLLVAVIWGWRMRKRGGEVFDTHSRWIVRSFWISSVLSVIAMLLSTSIVSANADRTAVEGMADAIRDGAATPEQITAMVTRFQIDNQSLILAAMLGCFGPVVVHVIVRAVRGYRLAYAGRPVENFRTWLI